MQLDEVIRLKQITGIAALFKDRAFSEAWEPANRVNEDDDLIGESDNV